MAASAVKLLLEERIEKKESHWDPLGRVHVNTFFYLSDMRNGHGAWNILTASSLTRRELCHHPWGPVNAAVLRAWRHGPGALHTVVTLTPIGRAYRTETPSTRWETLRTVTGGKQACVADMALGLSWTFWEVSFSAGSLSASRGQSGYSERLSGNWHTAGMMMKYAKVGKSEKLCAYSYWNLLPWPLSNSDWLVFPLIIWKEQCDILGNTLICHLFQRRIRRYQFHLCITETHPQWV